MSFLSPQEANDSTSGVRRRLRAKVDRKRVSKGRLKGKRQRRKEWSQADEGREQTSTGSERRPEIWGVLDPVSRNNSAGFKRNGLCPQLAEFLADCPFCPGLQNFLEYQF